MQNQDGLTNKEQQEILNDLHKSEDEARLALDEYNLYGPDGSTESQLLSRMAIRNRIRAALLKKDDQAPKINDSKSVTFRLAFSDYSKLKVLSDKLRQSPSGLARTILIDGISEAINAYLEVVGDEHIESFTVESEELATDLHIESGEQL